MRVEGFTHVINQSIVMARYIFTYLKLVVVDRYESRKEHCREEADTVSDKNVIAQLLREDPAVLTCWVQDMTTGQHEYVKRHNLKVIYDS